MDTAAEQEAVCSLLTRMKRIYPVGSQHPMFRHGCSHTPIYMRFKAMHNRCGNSSVSSFKYYGAKGIRVCERWSSFENFLADMGIPEPGQSIDRINSDGDYEPSNCRWVDRVGQANNKRNNKIIEVDGVKKTIAQWARESNQRIGLVQSRLKRGWAPKDAIFLPPGNSGIPYRKFAGRCYGKIVT